MHAYRTHNCAQLRAGDVGQRVKLSGWVHRKRDHGNLLFVDLRDHYGRLGDPAIAAAKIPPRRAETNFELTWQRRVSERLTLQPDVQYVVNPGWDPALRDALVLGVRLDLTLF